MRLRIRYLAEVLLVLLSVAAAYIAKPCLMFIPAKSEEPILRGFAADGWIVSYEQNSRTKRVSGLVVRAWLPGQRGEDPNAVAGQMFSSGISIPVNKVTCGARFVKKRGSSLCTIDGVTYEFYKPVNFLTSVVCR